MAPAILKHKVSRVRRPDRTFQLWEGRNEVRGWTRQLCINYLETQELSARKQRDGILCIHNSCYNFTLLRTIRRFKTFDTLKEHLISASRRSPRPPP